MTVDQTKCKAPKKRLSPAYGSEPQVPTPVLPPRSTLEDTPDQGEDNVLRRVPSVNLRADRSRAKAKGRIE